MVRWGKRTGITMLAILLIASIAAWWLFRQTHVVPEFYQQATQQTRQDTETGSYQLEANVAKLQEDASKPGQWKAHFSEDDINAWLIQQLPLKSQQLQISGAKDPRIKIEEDHLLVAARYSDTKIDTVISCELSVALTEAPNLLAVHIRKLKAGALPLPINQFTDRVTIEAAKAGVEIRWDRTETGPTALIQVPTEHAGYINDPVIIESIQLVGGAILLSGHTGTKAEDCYAPRSHVHQFVTYRHAAKRKAKTGSASETFSSRR